MVVEKGEIPLWIVYHGDIYDFWEERNLRLRWRGNKITLRFTWLGWIKLKTVALFVTYIPKDILTSSWKHHVGASSGPDGEKKYVNLFPLLIRPKLHYCIFHLTRCTNTIWAGTVNIQRNFNQPKDKKTKQVRLCHLRGFWKWCDMHTNRLTDGQTLLQRYKWRI